MAYRDVYMNRRQQQIFYSNPRICYLQASRRFGKTDGGLAPRIYRVQQSLPGSTNVIIGSSRAQLLRRTVPAMMAAVERFFGLKEGVHWGYGKPPKSVPKPVMTPRSWDSCIWFANGAYFQLISLATMGSANGLSICSIIGDEVKFLPYNKIQGEVLPALSGQTHPLNDERFSEWNPLYKSIFFASDASLTAKGNWLEKLESILEEEIESGPFKGKTYGWLQHTLEQYSDFCSDYNEQARQCRLAGGQRIVCRPEEIDYINSLAEQMMNHEGEFKIMPNYGKRINKAMLDMAINYKLITSDEAELIFNRQWLLTPEQDMRSLAIKANGKWNCGPRKNIDIRTMQREARCFFRANTLDNIDILGESYVRDMKKTLAPVVFQISILNLKSVKINDGFYANLDVENVHGYVPDTINPLNLASTIKTATSIVGGTAYKEEYSSVDFERLTKMDDCSMDGDVADSLPLYVAMDYNARINWIATGQVYQRDGVECLNTLSSKFVKNEKMLQDLVEEWCRYYEPHRRVNRNVTYFYDSTAKHRAYAITHKDFKDAVIEIMEKHGWIVTPVDMGVPMHHSEKYQVINEALAGLTYPAVRFNRENNEPLLIAMENTDVIKLGKEFKKHKAGEKLSESTQAKDGSESVPYELRTDGTDAWDALYLGVKYYRGGMLGTVTLPMGWGR